MTMLSEKNLKQWVKESVREVLQEEWIKIRLLSIPEVSDEEMNDIKKQYGKPQKGAGRTVDFRGHVY